MQDLIRDLDAEFARDPAGTGVASLLERFAAEGDAWQTYAHFCDDRPYARNLVRESKHYELIVICWNAGETSPIHDHAGQRCWMGTLTGQIQETLFEFPDGSGAPLTARSTRVLEPGQVAFITDEIALHEIRPAGDGRAVSLHLYAHPIRNCKLYDPATGEVEERCLSYHSIDGQLQPS